MCGIAGFYGPFDMHLLNEMGEAVAHRGPDDAGSIIIDKSQALVGLAHRRLSIIDLSAEGRQPMWVDCGCCGVSTTLPPEKQLWLVYNGEIYNYRELRSHLQSLGHRFRSQTDSEVLLHLYAEEGLEMLNRLNGIFAFALYDGRENGSPDGIVPRDLFLARDGFGVKPLYYAETAGGFLFASELKALLLCPELSRELDLVALHQYLAYLWAPAPRTPLSAVKKCRPGEAIIVREGRIVKRWSFYDLPYGQQWLDASEREIAKELCERLETAVHRQMVSDVPVGAFLSGGLDSSSVVAMMRRAMPDYRPTCYCIGFANDAVIEGNPPDLPYARSVAEHLDVDLHTIEVEPDIIENLERTIYLLDEPQADPAPINVLLIAQQARRHGYKVLLSGAGGDDIFSGYRRHWALKMERMWGWLPRGIRMGIARKSMAPGNERGLGKCIGQQSWFRRINKMLMHADLSPEDRLIAYFYWSGEQVRRSVYSADLAAELMEVDTAEPLRQSLRQIPDERDPLNRMLYLEAKHFLADHNLNYTDKLTMAVGVETRVPLLDPDLVNFATRIPPWMKQKGRTGKAIFKKAMEPHLPKNVIYRPKTGFGAPLRRWLHQELREMVQDVLSKDSLSRNRLFDPVSVHRLVEMDRMGRVDAAYTILALVCIELWCSMFVGRKAVL
jgi:asparagine synthase (glutamine-hydrolysing)